MLRFALRSSKVRALLVALLTSILILVLSQVIDIEAAKEIAPLIAGLIVAVAGLYCVGRAIEHAGEKASGRNPSRTSAYRRHIKERRK